MKWKKIQKNMKNRQLFIKGNLKNVNLTQLASKYNVDYRAIKKAFLNDPDAKYKRKKISFWNIYESIIGDKLSSGYKKRAIFHYLTHKDRI